MYRPEIGAREGRLQMYGDEWLFCSVGKRLLNFMTRFTSVFWEQIGHIRQVTEDIKFTFIGGGGGEFVRRVRILLKAASRKHLLSQLQNQSKYILSL